MLEGMIESVKDRLKNKYIVFPCTMYAHTNTIDLFELTIEIEASGYSLFGMELRFSESMPENAIVFCDIQGHVVDILKVGEKDASEVSGG